MIIYQRSLRPLFGFAQNDTMLSAKRNMQNDLVQHIPKGKNTMKGTPIDLNYNISREISCSCGHTHFSGVKLIDIDQGALTRLPGHIRDLGYHKVFLVADINTWKAAGEAVSDALAKAAIPCENVILNDKEVIPDEKAIGEIMTAYPMGYDLVLGVGSGTLNDLCKFVSHRLGIDYIIFATAPSMDGFVSIGSALMLRHVKTTLDCQGPVAVIGDTDILSAAPMHLIAADGIIALENKAGKNDVAKRNRRLLSMKQHWPEIQRTIEEYLPATGDMIDLLTSLHAPVEVTQMGVPAPWAREAVVVAKEVRERYTLLQMLWDLGLAEKYAPEI